MPFTKKRQLVVELPKFSGFNLRKINWKWERYQPFYVLLAAFLGGMFAVLAAGADISLPKLGDSYVPSNAGENQGAVKVSADDDAVLGDSNASVTIIEFVDFECPFCKSFFTETYPQLKKDYIDTGKVKFVLRDFPLDFHNPAATKEAIAAECSKEQGGDSVYFAYHDEIFTRTGSNGKGMPEAGYTEAAQKLGLNVSQFTSCLTSEKYKEEVQKDLADGQAAQVSGTPTFFINGTPLVGAQPFESFKTAIEAELAK